MKNWHKILRLFAISVRKEIWDIATLPSSMMLIVGGMVAYGLLYNLLYQPNIVRKAPIVVVDNSRTQLSRHLTSLVDASPNAQIVAVAADVGEARSVLSRGEAEAILYLPYDMDKRIGRGEQSLFVILSTTATFLYYEATVGAVEDAMLALDNDMRRDMLWILPAPLAVALDARATTEVVGNALFNPTRGYADYLVPVVFVIIIFQTMVMVVSMNSAGRKAKRITPMRGRTIGFGGRVAITLARSATYCAIYGALSLFLIGWLPRIFHLPHLASAWELVAMMSPFLLATSLFGQAFGRLFNDREAPIVLITFFSVGLIFISGISYPLQLLPMGWQAVHYLFPIAPAILAFVELGSMGSSLADITPQLSVMWLQVGGYLILATLIPHDFR